MQYHSDNKIETKIWWYKTHFTM